MPPLRGPADSPATPGVWQLSGETPIRRHQEPALRQPFRLLVTGSRTWDDAAVIEHALAVILARHPEGVLLVHGACPRGADAIAAAYADRNAGYRIEAHPADWRRHGRAAGQLRNAEMIALGADGCIAFLQGASPGTTATIRLARAAGIPVWLHARAAGAEPQPGT